MRLDFCDGGGEDTRDGLQEEIRTQPCHFSLLPPPPSSHPSQSHSIQWTLFVASLQSGGKRLPVGEKGGGGAGRGEFVV